MYINSQLHRAWKESTKQWAREATLRRDGEGPDGRMAPRPSLVEPPPEEFGEVLRSLLPFLSHGVSHSNFSAILAATGASIGVDQHNLYPALYFGGASTSVDGIRLSLPRDYVGMPLVYMEPFPLRSIWPDFGVPVNIISPPDSFVGQVAITSYENHLFLPRNFTAATIPPVSENTHALELARTASGLSGVYVEDCISRLRYTGSIRIATEPEIDALFATVIRPECWLKCPRISFRDMFSLSGVPMNIVDNSSVEGERILRASNIAPSAPVNTDVPARPARNRSIDLDDIVPSSAFRRSTPANRGRSTQRAPRAPQTTAPQVPDLAVPSPFEASRIISADDVLGGSVPRTWGYTYTSQPPSDPTTSQQVPPPSAPSSSLDETDDGN